jgi:DNA-repair protein complementing XP-A cells
MDFICEACGSLIGIDSEFHDNFGVSVCFSCKDSNELYGIITKTQARSEYLLTDEELADSILLPSISRKNPHNPRWADMKLYLRRQVREFAVKKHGSEKAMKEALANRTEARTDRKSKQFLKKLKGILDFYEHEINFF